MYHNFLKKLKHDELQLGNHSQHHNHDTDMVMLEHDIGIRMILGGH